MFFTISWTIMVKYLKCHISKYHTEIQKLSKQMSYAMIFNYVYGTGFLRKGNFLLSKKTNPYYCEA